MPHKDMGEAGMKSKRSKKSDKAKRTFELNGAYSAKHLRLREAANEMRAAAGSAVKEASRQRK